MVKEINGKRGNSGDESVPALRRAIQVLDLVTGHEASLTAADITRILGLPKSTAHGLLKVMVELNLLLKQPSGALRLGPHPMRWASGFLAEIDVVSAFYEFFAQETALLHHTMTLTMLDGDHVVYIGCRNSDQPMGLSFRIGMRLPAPFTATGKMLLSELSETDLNAMFASGFPPPMTSASVRNLEQLRTELRETRRRGYSIDNEQVREGVICIGSAIRDHSGYAIAGVATSILQSEADDQKIADLGAAMMKVAEHLSVRMGRHP